MKIYYTLILLWLNTFAFAQEIYQAPAPTTQTRWISPENPTGEKGKGGSTNQGAKGSAFFTVKEPK